MRERFLAVLRVISNPAVALGGAVVIAGGAIGITYYLTSVAPNGAYIAVANAPITEEVDVSGVVKAAENTDLSFQRSGQVSYIAVKVGDQVGAGQTLLALDHSALDAQLEGAEANLEAAQANFASLQSGTRSEQLAIDQTAVTQAQDTLRDALQSAYVAADDAVHNKADQLFTNPRSSSPTLSFLVPDQNLVNKLETERVALEPVLTAWQMQISAPTFSSTDPSAPAASAEAALQQVSTFLADANQALAETTPSSSLPSATLSAYVSAVAAGRSEVSGSLSTLTGDQTALAAAEGALTLAEAGATPDALKAGQAQVDAAQAAVDGIRVQIAQSIMTAPISGTVTLQSANPGETVSPGIPLVSLIGTGAFEADAQVSQTDFAKVAVGDPVNATFDSYGSATFPATVTTIDPAATMDSNGVPSYKVTVTFTAMDPRISSGLTAHLAIITATKASALVVPSSAIISDNGAEFVYVKQGSGAPLQTNVTTGLQSASGMTEITSGLSAGQEVLTFGANAQ